MKICLAALLLLPGLSPAVATESVGCFLNAPFDQEDWKYCQEINEHLFVYYTPTEDNVMLGLHATKDARGWSALAFGGNGGKFCVCRPSRVYIVDPPPP